ncbi:hypothetical protein [uncultured Psychrobacter sp.]|uniref:hypothetical protein n=1 Tax=uncultured Psychrobacter sp. TaxID=259303 RepID=UPI0030DDA93F
MQQTIDEKMSLLSKNNDRYGVSKPTAAELDILARHEDHKSLVDRDHAVKLTDQLSQKEMLLYGALPFNSEKNGGYDGSQYKLVTLERNKIVETDNAMLLAGIDIKRLEIPDSETYDIANGRSAGDIVPIFMAESEWVLRKENIALSMAHIEHQVRSSYQMGDKSAPDQREKLRGHIKLNEQIEVLSEQYKEHNYNLDATEYESPVEYIDKANELRGKALVANLMPENMMLVNGKLLEPEFAEAYTNNRYAALKPHEAIELGDVEGRYEIVRSRITGADGNNEGYQTGYLPDSDRIMAGVRFSEKAESIDRNEVFLYVVKDSDDLLWLRAKQSRINSGNVYRENEAVFESLGINPKTLLQGVPATDGVVYATERRQMDAKQLEKTMLAQVSPNNIRKMISRQQIEQHNEISNQKLLDPSQPSVLDRRDPKTETLSQAMVSAKYPVIKELAGDELNTFKEYSEDQDKVISDTDNIAKAFMLKDNKGDVSMLVLATRTHRDDSQENVIYVESFDKDGKYKNVVEPELMNIDVGDFDRSSVFSVRRGIEKLPQYSDEEKLKNAVELRGSGTENEHHPAIKPSVSKDAEASVGSQGLSARLGAKMNRP